MSFVARYNSASWRGWQSPIGNPYTSVFSWGPITNTQPTTVVTDIADDYTVCAAVRNYNNTVNSAIIIWAYSNGTWTQQLNYTLTDFTPLADDVPNSIAISRDGNIVAVSVKEQGGPDYFVLIFTRSGSTWTQTNALSAAQSVSLNNDGTHLVASVTSNSTFGSVSYYTRSGTNWTLQTAFNSPTPAIGDYFGISLDISYDSNTLVVMGTNATNNKVYVYTRSGTVWNLAYTLTPSLPANTNLDSVWMNYDGTRFGYTTVQVLGPYPPPTNYVWTTYIYTGSGATWSFSQQIAGYSGSRSASNTKLLVDRMNQDTNNDTNIYALQQNSYTLQTSVSSYLPNEVYTNIIPQGITSNGKLFVLPRDGQEGLSGPYYVGFNIYAENGQIV